MLTQSHAAFWQAKERLHWSTKYLWFLALLLTTLAFYWFGSQIRVVGAGLEFFKTNSTGSGEYQVLDENASWHASRLPSTRPRKTPTTCWGHSTHSSLGIPSGTPCWKSLPGSGMSGIALWHFCCRNRMPAEEYNFKTLKRHYIQTAFKLFFLGSISGSF